MFKFNRFFAIFSIYHMIELGRNYATLKGPVSFIKKLGQIHGMGKAYQKKSKTFAASNFIGDKARWHTQPQFQNCRNNASEFGAAGSIAKDLNAAIGKTFLSADGNIFRAFVKRFVRIIKVGVGNAGQRPFDLSLNMDIIKFMTIGRRSLKSVLVASYTAVLAVGRNQMVVTFPTIAANTYVAPPGATHFRVFLGFYLVSDFAFNTVANMYLPVAPEGNLSQIQAVYSAWLPVGTDVAAPTILTAGDGSSLIDPTDTAISILAVEFAQEVNTIKNVLIGRSAASIINVG
jgi:hypothetical protein